MLVLGGRMDRRTFLGGASSVSVSLSLPARILASEVPADITELSASKLSAAIKQQHVSCVEVMQSYLARLHRYNPVYNAVVSMLDDDYLVEQARLADQALHRDEYWGWMHGMPHAIKNLANARGLESSEGSPIFAGTIADADDLHVARIRSQGAIFIGKTNTPEFGLGSQSYNPVHGATGSAYDPTLTAGGSSGGAACGMATHMLPIADGSDMMGSLRNPGAFNNVIGFRPTQGRVPSVPQANRFHHQLSTNGPMGRNTEDTIRLLATMSGFDPRSPLSRQDKVPGYDDYRPPGLSGFKIGWMGDYDGYLATEEGVLGVCTGALEKLSAAGAIVEDCMPDYNLERLWRTWLTFRHWTLSDAKPFYDDPDLRAQLKPEFVWEIEGGLNMPASRVSQAGVDRTDWYLALLKLFESYDILALPTAQVFPFSKDLHWPKQIGGRTMDTYHRWMEVVIGGTLSGLPVVNVPAGFDARGRPMGMQFLGRVGDDERVLEFALAYERATDYLQQRPTMVEALA